MSSVLLSKLRQLDMGRDKELALAMAKSGAGSVMSGLLSAGSAKLLAITGGPAAVAQLVTLQQIRQIAVVASTANGQTALVQGASALQGASRRSYVRTVAVFFVCAAMLVSIAMLVTPRLVANGLGLQMANSDAVRWLAIPVALTSMFVFLSSLLNALGVIGGLAVAQIAAGGTFFSGILVTWCWFGSRRIESLLWAMALSAAASIVVVLRLLVNHSPVLRKWISGDGPWWSGWAIRRFLSVSVVMFATGCLGSISLLAVRAHVTSSQGHHTIGQFDAAWTISMTHVTLALASLQTYYLPALARCNTREERTREMENALSVIPWVAVAVIVVLGLTKAIVLKTLYSSQFLGASRYLRWTLLGDYWKVASWVYSTPLIAAGRMNAFFWLDLLAHATFVVAAFSLTTWWSAAESAAIAFLVMYLVYFAACLACGVASGMFAARGSTVLRLVLGFAAVLTSSLLYWGEA